MMWNKIKDFYNSNRYAIIWTACYVFATWAIMRYMFNFNIFSAHRWHQLFHAHLYGFAGFVFGILILAMVPLYIATTIVITRTKAPLFNFKITIPSFIKTYIKNAFTQTPMPDTEPATTTGTNTPPTPDSAPTTDADSTQTTDTPAIAPIPDEVPAEMRVAYARARDNISHPQKTAFDLAHMTQHSAQTAQTESLADDTDIPIPMDFDISDTENIIGDAPVFTDIDFDSNDETDNDTEPTTSDVRSVTDDNDIVIKYLTAKSVPYTIDGDVVITDKFAIASHTDSDFWVAENESWFATGKIRLSPIESVSAVATVNNVQPVLYLGANNIMDIDELRAKWESNGVRVIDKLDDLT